MPALLSNQPSFHICHSALIYALKHFWVNRFFIYFVSTYHIVLCPLLQPLFCMTLLSTYPPSYLEKELAAFRGSVGIKRHDVEFLQKFSLVFPAFIYPLVFICHCLNAFRNYLEVLKTLLSHHSLSPIGSLQRERMGDIFMPVYKFSTIYQIAKNSIGCCGFILIN
jgi:hypothetical protein